MAREPKQEAPTWHSQTTHQYRDYTLREPTWNDAHPLLLLQKKSRSRHNVMVELVNIFLKYLYSTNLFLSDMLVFLESGAGNNFLAVKIKAWISEVIDPICV